MPTANFFILIPTRIKRERESFRSRQNPIAVNLLSRAGIVLLISCGAVVTPLLSPCPHRSLTCALAKPLPLFLSTSPATSSSHRPRLPCSCSAPLPSFPWIVDAIVVSPPMPPPHRMLFLLPFFLPFVLFSLTHSVHRHRVVIVAAVPIARAPPPMSMAFPPSLSSSVVVRDAMTFASIPGRHHRHPHSEGNRRASSAKAG